MTFPIIRTEMRASRHTIPITLYLDISFEYYDSNIQRKQHSLQLTSVNTATAAAAAAIAACSTVVDFTHTSVHLIRVANYDKQVVFVSYYVLKSEKHLQYAYS